ncbi:MAG: nitroreductase family protein [Sphaerochaetaceae bacterium]|nr:nitroreductase family protein [Sphaerochaetaceae bacterium]
MPEKDELLSHPVIDLLMKRRSTRSFDDKKIPQAIIDTIKKATLRAPTAGNQVFYSVIEVEDQQRKERLARLCDNQPMIAKAPLVWLFLADVDKWNTYYRESGSMEKGKAQGIEVPETGLGEFLLATDDALIAAQNAVIAAESFGIGSCYIGDILENHEEIVSLFSLSQHVAVATLVIFGYPKSKNALPVQSIRPPSDTVFMKDTYTPYTIETLRYAYGKQEEDARKKKRLPFDNTGSIADEYYFRKHTSDFMKEMNRSSELIIRRWKDPDCQETE